MWIYKCQKIGVPSMVQPKMEKYKKGERNRGIEAPRVKERKQGGKYGYREEEGGVERKHGLRTFSRVSHRRPLLAGCNDGKAYSMQGSCILRNFEWESFKILDVFVNHEGHHKVLHSLEGDCRFFPGLVDGSSYRNEYDANFWWWAYWPRIWQWDLLQKDCRLFFWAFALPV